MDFIIGLIRSNWSDILIVIIIMGICITLWIKGKRNEVKYFIYRAAVLVEDKYYNPDIKQGETKRLELIDTVYRCFPKIIKLFITPKDIDEWLKYILDNLEEWSKLQIYKKEN